MDDLTQQHDRGNDFLWLAVLKDPSLAKARKELETRSVWTLSSASLFQLHSRLVNLPPLLVESYVADLLEGSRDLQNVIIGTIDRRLDRSVPFEGFIQYNLRTIIVP